jgi:hypothetical protein
MHLVLGYKEEGKSIVIKMMSNKVILLVSPYVVTQSGNN